MFTSGSGFLSLGQELFPLRRQQGLGVSMSMTAKDQSGALDPGQIVALDNVNNVLAAERRPTVFPCDLRALFLDARCDFFSDLGKVLRITDRIVR
jgi:hypothetical protein